MIFKIMKTPKFCILFFFKQENWLLFKCFLKTRKLAVKCFLKTRKLAVI